MSIDVIIKQKLFGRKTMPLEVILGEHLHYGNFVQETLNVGELGDNEFIAYNPKSIGRGFSVVWNPNEKKAITLRLLHPTTTQELKDFFAAIARMVKYWNATLFVDDTRIRLRDFLASFDDMVESNDRALKWFSKRIIDGESAPLTLYSAMWPLDVGAEDAARFMENPDCYAKWLHEKQAMDVYYATPYLFTDDHGILARYILMNGIPTVLPYRPVAPFGTMDPSTGEQLKCNTWLVWICVQGEEEPLCEMEYAKFLNNIPDSKKSKYDENHFLLDKMTEEEIRALANQ